MNYIKFKSISIMFFASLILAFVACEKSGIKNEKITLDNLSELADKAKDDDNLSKDEIASLINCLTRFSGMKDSVVGKTIGQILDKEMENNKANNFKLLKQTAIRSEMSMNYNLKYLGLAPVLDSISKQPLNVIYFELTNNSIKDIKAITGLLQLINQQNQLIKQFPVTYKDAIMAGKTIKFYQAYTHNEKDSRDNMIRTDKNLIYLWNPESIEFTDGKKLTLVEKK